MSRLNPSETYEMYLLIENTRALEHIWQNRRKKYVRSCERIYLSGNVKIQENILGIIKRNSPMTLTELFNEKIKRIKCFS